MKRKIIVNETIVSQAGVDRPEAENAAGGPVSTKLRRRRYWIYLVEGLFFVAVFAAVSAYQSRTLLAANHQIAPGLTAQTLTNEPFSLFDSGNRPTLVYFFAPWCRYCAASADNIVRLRELRDEKSLSIVVVGLDWQNVDELRAFAMQHELNVPVLIGDSEIASAWQIHGFPAYYVVDSQKRIVRRDYGYSTQLGLWWRTWLVD